MLLGLLLGQRWRRLTGIIPAYIMLRDTYRQIVVEYNTWATVIFTELRKAYKDNISTVPPPPHLFQNDAIKTDFIKKQMQIN